LPSSSTAKNKKNIKSKISTGSLKEKSLGKKTVSENKSKENSEKLDTKTIVKKKYHQTTANYFGFSK
jgi:hypothetical protein